MDAAASSDENLLRKFMLDCSVQEKQSNKSPSIEELKRILLIAKKNPTYGDFCVKIVYQYFYDASNGEYEASVLAIREAVRVFNAENVLNMQNKFHRNELLKIIFIHMEQKDEIEIISERIEKLDMSKFEHDFFKLAKLLHDKDLHKFERLLKTFLDDSIDYYGDYSNESIKVDLRLLLAFMKRNNMTRTIEMTVKLCPFVEINSTILTTHQEIQPFQLYIDKFKFKNKQFNKALVCIFQ
jgi:hypothetical protein